MLKAFFERKDESFQREIKEITGLMLKRIDRKISELKAIEKTIDEKIETLRALLQKAEELRSKEIRKEEIVSLYRKGLKIEDIASSLQLPQGEVELVLRLCKIYPQGKNFLSESRQF